MRLSICNEMFENWPWERVCRFVGQAGYEGVEVAPFTLAESVEQIAPEQRMEIRRQAEQAGLQIVGLHWLLVSPKGLYLNHPDQQVREQTADYLSALVHFCADIGGSIMVFGSPKQRSVHAGLSFQQAWELAKQTFARPLDAARQRAVTICLEPLSPEETDFINTAEQARAFIEQVGHPNLRLLLDVKAMSSESKPIPQIIRDSKQYLAHVHANDANRRGPGFGSTDFGPIAAALAEIGYDRWLSVEVFDFKPDPETIARESLRYLKRFF